MAIQRLEGPNKMGFKIAVFEGIKQSATAHRIWTWLEKSERDFDVIILGQGENFGQMLTEQDRSGVDAVRARGHYSNIFGTTTILRPVVLWNPNYQFDYFGDVKGVHINSSGDITPMSYRERKGYIYHYKVRSARNKVTVVRVTQAKMPSWIVLFHELGHVTQYFKGNAPLDSAWATRLANTQDIEAENLTKHENPICVETGLPIRAHYKHSTYGFLDLRQRYSVGKKQNAWKAADSLEERKRIEQDLKSEAERNARLVPAPDDGIFFPT
ncbi:MAG: hypothetical protein ABFS39_01380 [Pseudomonadota bacterium]